MNRKHPVVYALLFAVLLSLSSASFAQISVGVAFNVRIAPPALPVYEQPICPGPGYLWTPGYWAWNDDAGYYWVPGTWVVAPVGLLWTPGYWGWGDGAYGWHAGYWGPHIGFYGGVNYGFGYGGVGFVGGEWRGHAFFYNSAVMHVDRVHITNVYVNRTVIVHNESHVAFNGGEGGITARPTHAEEIAEHEHHMKPLAAQTRQEHAASRNRQNFASENHGRPAIAATARPGEFKGHGVVAAKSAGAAYHAPAMSPKEARGPARPAESRNNAASKNSGRTFTPPAKNNASNNNPRANKSAGNAARPSNQFHPVSHTASAPRQDNTRAQNSRPQSAARPSQPRSQPKSEARPARQESAPKEQRKTKGR